MNQIFHVYRYAHVLNATFRRLQNRERELEAILHGHNTNKNANRKGHKNNLSENNILNDDDAIALSDKSLSGSKRNHQIEVAFAPDHPCSGKSNLPWGQRRTCVGSLLAVSRALSLADDCMRYHSSTKSIRTSTNSSRSSKNAYGIGVGRNTRRRSSQGVDLDDWPGEGRKSGSIVAMLDVDTWEAVSNQRREEAKK